MGLLTAARFFGSVPFLGVLVGFLISFPSPLAPAPGVDASWVVGLQMAATDGLDFGSEIVFTFGPLGFLDNPQVTFDATAVTAALWGLAGRLGLGIALVWVARERFGTVVGLLVAAVVALLTTNTVIALSLATVLGLLVLRRQGPSWLVGLVVYGGGALAATSLLVKLNFGVAVAVISLAAVLGADDDRRWFNLGGFAAAFVATGAVLWLLSGQGAGNVDDFVGTSIEVISGYSEAMSADYGAVGWHLAVSLLMIGALFGATVWTTRELAPIARVAAAVIVGVLAMTLFKQAFVRQAAPSLLPFVGGLAAAWVALPWGPRERLAGVAGCLAMAAFAVPASTIELKQFDPIHRVENGVDQLSSLVDPATREELRDEAAERMRSSYALDPKTLSLVDDRPVAIYPWEAGIAWAYDLDWDPLPVFQSYVAYTPDLDRRNAEALVADHGPPRVLRHTGAFGPQLSVDGRVLAFDAPTTTLALLCNFRELSTTVDYQVLARSRGRCGAERPLATVEAGWGEPVPVPAAGPGEAVLVRVDGVEPGGLEQLVNVLYRADKREVVLGIDGSSSVFRLVPSTAATGLLLRVPPKLDFPSPYNLALNASTVAIEREGGGDQELSFEFYAIAVGSQ